MPRADTHESAARGATNAKEQLLDVARGKAAVAVPDTSDRFARTAAEAKRTWKQHTEDSK